MNKYIKNWWTEIDTLNFLLVLILIFIGIILSFSINDSYFLFQKHFIYALFSLLIIVFLSSLDLKTLRRIALLGLIISVFLMVIILFMDYEIKGSKRWIKFFNFSLQPSEFLKPFFLLVSGWFLSKGINGQKIAFYFVFISFFILVVLLILQPDFGMTILFAVTFFCQLFIAGLSIFFISVAILLLMLLSIFSYLTFDHVKRRIDIFLDPNIENYQISKSLEAFKSGGLLGKGPGNGILKEKIPDAHTDFIFAVAGEELGFIVCCIIVALFLILIIRNLLKVLRIQEPYVIIAILGLISSFGLQAFINICSSLNIIPTKGMTLPLISYGGSSLISSSILVGFLLSLTKKINEKK